MFLMIFGAVCIVIVLVLLSLVLFEPSLPYDVTAPPMPLDSEGFLCLMGALADADVQRHNTIEVLSGGPAFYEAELAAIRNAQQSVHVEAFLFQPGAITDQFIHALAERARAGVHVRVVLDAIGCFQTPRAYLHELEAAGGKMFWYEPIRWRTLKRINNRTHRELIIVDGQIGFIGGAGISPHWLGGVKGEVPWHDMMCRVRGPLVGGLQTTFAENWLQSSGQILTGPDTFPQCCQSGTDADQKPQPGNVHGIIIDSTPTAAGATRARVIFQVLLASAKQSIHINSPYFLPDRSARRQLIEAVRRGVKVQVLAPGEANNHHLTRCTSRRLYGELLQEGVEIYEYQPGMIHKKAMIVDGVWTVVGSTNFDT